MLLVEKRPRPAMTVGSFLQFKGVHADSVSFMPMATSIREAVKSLCPARPATDMMPFRK